MGRPFIIYGLPRSRTFWLSRFLSYGDWHCGHDEIRHLRSMEDVDSWFQQPCTGTVETAGAPWWRLTQRYEPRIVVVRRPVADVIESLMRVAPFDRSGITALMARLDRKLDQIERRAPCVLSVRFEDLASEEACARVFEHCLPYRHNPEWWAMMAPLNLQIDMPALLRYCAAHDAQLRKLTGIAKHRSIASIVAKRPVSEPDGVTFQTEPFDDWYRDAVPLFKEHMDQTGQAIDDYTRKNIPLLRVLDGLGFMQITTARSNGRMFGYLMAVMSPSLDAENAMDAMHLPFFVSKEMPGLGMKLQRASIEGLRARGVGEVFMRAGVRGSGPRLGTMYRRLGAEPFGELYKLDLVA